MENHITIEIPQQWVKELDWEQDAVVQEVIQLGIEQLKIRRALTLYRTGNVSLGYAAEKVGLAKRDLIREARSRGIEPPFDEEMVDEELNR
jgi:predicted HTH domain antitoxin